MTNPLSIYKRCTIAGLCATGMLFSVASQAIMIDDFNVSSTWIATDTLLGGGASNSGSAIAGSTVMDGQPGWSRRLRANLTAGDKIETEVCSNCQAGHVNMSGGDSNGRGTFIYNGGVIDMSGEAGLSFDWGADLAGARVNVIFRDSTGATETVASWSGLAATGGSAPSDLVPQALMAINFGTLDAAAIDQVRFVVRGVPNMDSIIDNIQTSAVPLPAAVYFFGSALLGLVGISRRRKVAAA